MISGLVKMYSSSETLSRWLSTGFWLWICNDFLYSSKDQCLNLSITTQLSRTRDYKVNASTETKFPVVTT